MPILSLLTLLVTVLVLLAGVLVAMAVAALAYLFGQAVWTCGCVLTVRMFRPKGKRWPWMLASIPLFLPLYASVLALGFWLIWPKPMTSDQSAFEYAFDQPVHTGVVIHEHEVQGWGDWEELHLRFNVTPNDLRAITSRGLMLVGNYPTSDPATIDSPFGAIPLAGRSRYEGGSPDGRFSSIDDATLIYDPATGEAWYWYNGLD